MRPVSRAIGFVLAMAGQALVPAGAENRIVLDLPLACELGRSCEIQQYVDHDPSTAARDYQCGTLSYDGHNGTDFRLPTRSAQRAGVNVLAAADGVVARVRDGMEDIARAATGAPAVGNRLCGNGVVISHADGWETQYCHLAQHSVRVRPGQRLSAGTPLGQVGLSGATVFPHLHFTVRHKGAIVDPFAFGAPADSCGGGAPLWRPALAASLELPSPGSPQHGVRGGPRHDGGDRSRRCWRAPDRRCRALSDRRLRAQHRAQESATCSSSSFALPTAASWSITPPTGSIPTRRKPWCLPARSAPPAAGRRAFTEQPIGCWRTANRCWSRASR